MQNFAQKWPSKMSHFRGVTERRYVRWFHMAAEQGNADAQAALGNAYTLGEGALKDFAEAVRWYRLAAEQGNTDAQAALGEAYDSGLGVLKDLTLAHMW